MTKSASEIIRSLSRRIARLERQASEMLIYTDMGQCEYFGCEYFTEGAELVVSADALLRSNKEYDRRHKEYLQENRRFTLYLKRTKKCGPGWWEVIGKV